MWQILRGVLRISVLVLFVVGVYYGTRLHALTISTILVEGGETVSHDEIRAKAERVLEGTYLGIIPKRFTYLYPRAVLNSTISDVSRVYNVLTVKENATTLKITFDEYVPYALWCAYQRDDIPCYFLSESGFAFAEAPPLRGGALIRYYTESGTDIKKGNAIDSQLLTNITWFITHVDTELNFRISSVIYKNNKDVELFVNGGGMFLIASGKDILHTYENLKIILQSDAYKHLAPGNFKYVDVRFDNKVFVNEEMNAPITEDITVATGTPSAISTDVSTTAPKLPE